MVPYRSGQEFTMTSTIAELAEELHYTPRHVRRLLADGTLPVATRAHATGHWRIRARAAAKLVRHLRRHAGVTS
jgi:hypothetical protein